MKKLALLMFLLFVLTGCTASYPNKIRVGNTFEELDKACGTIMYGGLGIIYSDKNDDVEIYRCSNKFYHIKNGEVVKIEQYSSAYKHDVNLTIEQKEPSR